MQDVLSLFLHNTKFVSKQPFHELAHSSCILNISFCDRMLLVYPLYLDTKVLIRSSCQLSKRYLFVIALTSLRSIRSICYEQNCKKSTTHALIISGLSLKKTQSGSKLYHLIGYKLQYGRGHNVDTMTYNDVTNHVFHPLG